MASQYCGHKSCGQKTDYSGSRPKFCAFCGQPFDKAFAPVAVASTTTAIPVPYLSSSSHTYTPAPLPQNEFPVLDASSVSVSTEKPEKITFANLRNASFDRGDRRSVALPGGEVKSIDSVQDAYVKKITAQASSLQNQIPVQPTPTAPKRQSRRKK